MNFNNLCSLSRASLANQHSSLMILQTLYKRLFVLPDRKRYALLKYVIVLVGERLIVERIELWRWRLFR